MCVDDGQAGCVESFGACSSELDSGRELFKRDWVVVERQELVGLSFALTPVPVLAVSNEDFKEMLLSRDVASSALCPVFVSSVFFLLRCLRDVSAIVKSHDH